MANIRFLHDNAADRATLTASTTAGTLTPTNLKRNEKAAIWRSTGTTATITATWTTAEPVDSVVLGWTNLTALASVTVSLYAEAGDTAPTSTLTVQPDSALPLGEFVWGVDPLVQGGAQAARVASQAQVWLPQAAMVKKVTVVIDDPLNPLGYVEAGRIAIGVRRDMQVNPQYGVALGFVDRSNVTRAESGDVRAETQGIYRTLTLDFQFLEAADTTFLMRLASYSKSNAVFVSVFPDSSDVKRQAYAFFATLSGNQSVGYAFVNRWTNSITLEEIA